MKRIFTVVTVAALLVLVGAAPAFAQSGRVGFGEDITVQSDEVVDGDVLAFGGNVTIEDGGTVQGNVVAFGGNVVVNGRVDRDVVSFGGNVTLGPSAYVVGQVAHVGGNVSQSQSAFVGKGITGGLSIPGVGIRTFPNIPIGSSPLGGGLSGNIFGKIGTLILLAVVALLVASLLPRSLHVAQTAAMRQPWACFGIGLGTVFVGALVGLVLIVLVCTLPVGAMLWLGILAGSLMGWVVVGNIVGGPLLHALGAREYAVPLAAVVGVAVLYVVTQIPCLGFLIGLAITFVGLGAEVVTLFGTRPYGLGPSTSAGSQVIPPPPPPEGTQQA